MECEKRSYYPLMDICKLYCAILVVFIHACRFHEGQQIGNILIACLTQQAVPFFFIASGFLIGRRVNDKAYVVKYVSRLLALYFVWVLLWSRSIITVYLQRSTNPMQFFLLIVRRVLFAGYGVYWYILVLVEAVILLYLLRNHRKILCLLAIFGVLFGFIYDMNTLPAVNQIFYILFSWSDNVVMKGLPFVFLGTAIRNRQEKLCFSKKRLMIIYGSIVIIDIILYCIIGYGVLYPLEASTLFLFSIQNSGIRFPTKPIRDASAVCYYTHRIFLSYVVNPLLGFQGNPIYRFLLTLVLVGIFFIVIKLINNKWLNKLLSI